jgi:hypothetical protein
VYEYRLVISVLMISPGRVDVWEERIVEDYKKRISSYSTLVCSEIDNAVAVTLLKFEGTKTTTTTQATGGGVVSSSNQVNGCIQQRITHQLGQQSQEITIPSLLEYRDMDRSKQREILDVLHALSNAYKMRN